MYSKPILGVKMFNNTFGSHIAVFTHSLNTAHVFAYMANTKILSIKTVYKDLLKGGINYLNIKHSKTRT